MSCELDVVDCFGRRALLDHSNWEKHHERRPEAIPYHDQIAETLSSPHLVIQADRDRHFHFYRLGVADGRLEGYWLHVVVRESADNLPLKIASWWLSSTVDTKGQILWMQLPASTS